MNLLEITETHMRGGVKQLEELGSTVPMLWAHGPHASLVAAPYRDDALAASQTQPAIGLLTLLAVVTGMQVVGRTDEAWVRIAEPDDAEIVRGRLADRVSFDPEVRTAVVSHAIDIPSTRQLLLVAVECIRDDGGREWLLEEHDHPDGARAESLLYASAAALTVAELHDGQPLGLNEARMALDALGWRCERID